MPDGPILKLPEVPWTQPESVFDSGLTRAMRAINDLLGGTDPNSIMGIVGTLDVPGGAGALQKALGGLVERAKKGIKAYHGSPHDFERFDVSKIGTGEGAQAYGHGLYFAENEGVARGYRDALSPQEFEVGGRKFMTDASGVARDATGRTIGGTPQAVQDAARALQRMRHLGRPTPELAEMVESELQVITGMSPARIAAAKAAVETGAIKLTPQGRMYEVAIDADPEDFLDWDKPLSQQSEKVKAAIRAMVPEQFDRFDNPALTAVKEGRHPRGTPYDPTGHDILEDVASVTGEHQTNPAMTSRLRAQGVPGIKYLDAGSRMAGEGSRNYVVFDDKLVSILRKYGVAGALGAGYTAQQIQQAQQQQEPPK